MQQVVLLTGARKQGSHQMPPTSLFSFSLTFSSCPRQRVSSALAFRQSLPSTYQSLQSMPWWSAPNPLFSPRGLTLSVLSSRFATHLYWIPQHRNLCVWSRLPSPHYIMNVHMVSARPNLSPLPIREKSEKVKKERRQKSEERKETRQDARGKGETRDRREKRE